MPEIDVSTLPPHDPRRLTLELESFIDAYLEPGEEEAQTQGEPPIDALRNVLSDFGIGLIERLRSIESIAPCYAEQAEGLACEPNILGDVPGPRRCTTCGAYAPGGIALICKRTKEVVRAG